MTPWALLLAPPMLALVVMSISCGRTLCRSALRSRKKGTRSRWSGEVIWQNSPLPSGRKWSLTRPWMESSHARAAVRCLAGGGWLDSGDA